MWRIDGRRTEQEIFNAVMKLHEHDQVNGGDNASERIQHKQLLDVFNNPFACKIILLEF